MISVEEFLAAHPVPAAPQEVVTGRDKGRGGGKHTAVRDDVAVRDNADAREDAVAYDDAIGCHGADVREDDADCGDMAVRDDIAVHDDTAAPRSSARFGGTFGASRDDDVVRYARSGRRAGARKADRRDERRRSAGGFAVTQTDDPRDGERCKEAALRLLDAAARSTGALRAKLAERGYADDVIGEVVDRLTELRLLDDEEYARAVARSCANRMMGMRGAVMEMTRKGVDRALATRVAAEADADGLFVDAAWALGRSVAARTRGKDPQVARRRFWSAGGRKGHDSQTLREVGEALFSARGDNRGDE